MTKEATYKERYRPQYHFSMRRGWINDPNGLVHHNGLYLETDLTELPCR